MNKRIRELAEQATEDILGVKILNQQKFAELIVRECATVASMNNHQWGDCGSYVLRHFEVEQ
jgi:hypothetical protein